MQEVQRFNKVLKSFVLLGDIILLNLLLWMFTSIWENRSLFEYSMPLLQNMALMTLCYLVCNIRSGVILHRPVVRPEQIMLRVARNMIPFVLIVFGLSYIFHFECVNLRQLGVFVLGVFAGKEKDLAAEKKIFGKDFAYIRTIENFSSVTGRYLRKLLEEA